MNYSTVIISSNESNHLKSEGDGRNQRIVKTAKDQHETRTQSPAAVLGRNRRQSQLQTGRNEYETVKRQV
jgi:hypothetical protein